MATKNEILAARAKDIETVLSVWNTEGDYKETDAWKRTTEALGDADNFWSIDEPHVQGYRMDSIMRNDAIVQRLEEEREALSEQSGEGADNDDADEIDYDLVSDAVRVRIARELLSEMLESHEIDADIDPLFRMIPLGPKQEPPFLVFEVMGYSFSGVDVRWLGLIDDVDHLQEVVIDSRIILSKTQLDAMNDNELLGHFPRSAAR